MSNVKFMLWITAALLAAVIVGIAAPCRGGETLVEKYRLENGLTVVIRPNPATPVVAVQAWVKAGSAIEPVERAGMSHILEHMAFKGTKRRGPIDIAREVESLGGDINAYTSFDQTVYHITISGRFLENALDILSDTLENSVFDADELARELEVVLEEVRMNEDNPERVAGRTLFREAYRKHPYGRPVIGYVDTIKKTTREDLVAYFNKWYVPGNMVLVVTGGVDSKESRQLIEKTFGRLTARPVSEANRPVEPPQEKTRVVFREKDARRVYLEMGFHGPSMGDPDVYAWDLLSMILGSGETSRLNQVVKDRKGLVDSVYASSYTPKDPGLLVVGGVMSPEKAKEALREILYETFKTVALPPEETEMSRAKTVTESAFVYSLESVSALARLVGFYETTLNDAAFEQAYLRGVRAVTTEDIHTVAGKYLSPKNLTVSMVFPNGQKALEDTEVVRIAREAFEAATAHANKNEEKKDAVVKEVFPNGIRVIVREDRSVPVVVVEAGFLAGQRAEPAEKGGVSGLMAGMLTKGTKNRSALEIAEAVENMGAELYGYSGRNMFGLQGKFLSRDFRQGFRLFTESLRAPTFPEEELEKKRRETLGAIKQQKDQLIQAVFLLFMETHYNGHPYSRDPLGAEESIQAMTSADLHDYYRRWADPRNMVLTISGDIDPKEALKAARDAFGDFPKREDYMPLGAIPVPSLDTARKAREQRETQQAHFVIGYTGARFTDPQRYALDVLGSALAGMGGRLFVELRDRMSLAYSVTSFSSKQVDNGFFAFYMGTSTDKLDTAIAATLKIIGEVKKEGITQEEFERAKKWMIGVYEIGLQSNASYAGRMASNELYEIGYQETFEVPEKIAAVTLAEVNRLAAEVLDTEKYTIAILQGR
ncbi:MAG: insulinase family protein [Syntrophorhabdaceae bacterium]|nr:insulinase family protein [Syntrophorhabdaceae bacterium]